MRKHFLLFLLTVLLPLAGWAIDVTVTLYDFTIPYGSAEPTVATLPVDARQVTGATWDEIKGYLSFTRANTSNNVGVYEYTLTKAADTGEYTIFLSSNNAKMTIEKAPNSLAAPDYTAPVLAGNTTYAVVSASESHSYALVGTPGEAKFGDVEYIVSADAPAADAEGWSTTIPTKQYAGAYKVWYRVTETANYEGIDITELGTVTITGDPITVYTAPVGIDDLEYTGGAQSLITAGSATGGTMMYKVGDTGTWSDAIPQGTNKGDYKVYWMIEGDNTHSNYNEGDYVEVAIAKGTPSISPAPALIAGFTYDGTEHAILSSNGTASLGATISYQLKKQNGEDWDNVGVATNTPASLKIKDAGVYKVEYSIAGTENLIAVAAAQTATVTVAKKALSVSTKGCSKVYGAADPEFEVVYDGFVTGENKTNLSTQAVVGREAGTDAGYYALSFTTHAAATNYEINESETVNYLLINPKPITAVTITYGANPKYDGTAKEANITKVRFDGADKTLYNAETGVGDYTVTYDGTSNINAGDAAKVIITGKNNYTGSVEETFTIDPAALYIIPTAASKTYGGAEPTSFAYTLKVGDETVPNTTLNGDVVLARVAGENVGTYKIYVVSYTPNAEIADNYAPANVFNLPNSVDAANKIALFTINATSDNVLKLKFKDDIAAGKKTKVYGDANPAWSIDDLAYVSGLVGTDEWDVVKNNLGAAVFALASEDAGNTTVGVTGLGSPNYPDVEVASLAFEVTARPITVTVNDQAIDYGQGLSQANPTYWSITTGSLAGTDDIDDLGLTVKTENELATYGVKTGAYADAITAKITNTNYFMTVVPGDLTVNAGAAIEFTTASDMQPVISAYKNQNITVTFAADEFEMNIGEWYAMVLPFDIDPLYMVKKFDRYVIFNELNKAMTDDQNFKFTLTLDPIEAGTPFLIKFAPKDGDAADAVVDWSTPAEAFGAVAIKDGINDVETDYVTFTATYTTKTLQGLKGDNGGEKVWWLADSDYKGDNNWKKPKTNAHDALPFEAYLIGNSGWTSYAPNITVEDFDGQTTAIQTLNAEQINGLNVVSEGWYTLQGVKLDSAPTQKGIYIFNGKKVAVQ